MFRMKSESSKEMISSKLHENLMVLIVFKVFANN